MRRLPLPLFVLAMTTVVAPLWGDPPPTLPRSVSDHLELSGIDFAPRRAVLDQMFDGQVASLVALANDEDDSDPEPVDPGIRLRAYRALTEFGDQAMAVEGLRSAVARYRAARSGVELLYLVAALDSLGTIGDATDVDRVLPLLSAGESRDLRAAAARALGALGSTAACAPLRTRANDNVEGQGMVRSAASRALSHLGCEGS